MKTLLTILIALLPFFQLRAECLDPTDPNCQCTNCPAATNYPGPTHVYTNGEPYLLILATPTNVFVLLTNASLLNDYVIQRSFNLIDWTNITPKFEADSNGMADAAFPANEQQAYFRVIDATYVQYATIYPASGSFYCGTYVGYANYYGFDGSWGYVFETNMTRHIAYDGSGHTNRLVSYLAISSENGCGTYQVTVLPAYNPAYNKFRFSLFAVPGETVPQSNQPLRLKGIVDDADASRGIIAGPDVNAFGYFY